MSIRPGQSGVTLIELLISLTVMLLVFTGLASLMIENSRINKAQQLTAQIQSDARNSLAVIEQRLRSAGWDPLNAGIPTVALDSDLSDAVSEIEVFADIEGDGDGDTDDLNEQTLIRHVGDRILWRNSSDTTAPFAILAANISNDADGDGVVEPMFIPDSTTDPRRIRIRITARSPVPSPLTGEFLRFTVESDVVLRKAL